MLIWSKQGRAIATLIAISLFSLLFLLPLVMILMSSFSQQWNGILPSGFTFEHFVNAFSASLGCYSF